MTLLGCYGSPTLEGARTDPATPPPSDATAPGAPVSTADRGGMPVTPGTGPTAQASRLDELAGVLDRLESIDPQMPKNERPGAGRWRAAELEKLIEIVRGACAAGPGACRATLTPVADAHLPADEIWPLYSEFLAGLRPRAEEGTATLGRELLLRPEAVVRDRAFRLAVGSGAAVRGAPDAEGRRAALIPIHPGEGEPVLFVIEMPAACNRLTAASKGPIDSSGRLDVTFSVDCPEVDPADADGGTVPRAPRVVWAVDAGPLPASGLTLWIDGGAEPLLTVAAPTASPKEQ